MPQLALVWFEGENVSAFDDNICISVPCATDFQGGINGDYLIRTVDRGFGDTVDVKLANQAAQFTIGRSNLKLGVMDIAEQQFKMQPRNKKAVVGVNANKLQAQLKFCMQSIGHDVTHPEWCGISFEAVDNELHMYSGHSQVLAHATVPMEGKAKFKRVILHEKFCQQLLTYPKAELEISDSHAMLFDKETNTTVFGRAIGSGSLNLSKVLNTAVNRAEAFVELPNLDGMLQRQSIFEGDHLNMKVAVIKDPKGKRIRMTSESGQGKLVDASVLLKGDHPEVEVSTNAKHLMSGAELDEIAIGSSEIVMRGPHATLVVSVSDR